MIKIRKFDMETITNSVVSTDEIILDKNETNQEEEKEKEKEVNSEPKTE